MQYTPQQQAVIDAATDPSSPRLTVIGYAGAAKTTTMLAAAGALGANDRRGNAFFFNRAMADEMKARISSDGITRLSASTLHSLAYRAMRRRFGARVGERLVARDVAEALRYGSRELPYLSGPVTPTGTAYIAMSSLRVWCQSGSADMKEDHLRAGDHEDSLSRMDMRQAFRTESFRLARSVMNDEHDLPMSHDIYLKRFVEDVAAKRARGPTGDYLIGDEFQDANGVTMKFVREMERRGQQILIAGDPYQQIYQWRGSVDAMSRIQTDVTLELTQSFRFGQRLADLASMILTYLGASVRLEGNPDRSTRIVTSGRVSSPPGKGSAVICRSNAGCAEQAWMMVSNGQLCYLPKAGNIVATLDDIEALMSGGRARNTSLRVFKNADEFMEYVNKSSEAGEIAALLKLVEKFGLAPLKSLMESCSRKGADKVCVLTAHGSKGLQFDHVRLGNDFPDWDDLLKAPQQAREEMRLLYVAATRAKYLLDASGADTIVSMLNGACVSPGTFSRACAGHDAFAGSTRDAA